MSDILIRGVSKRIHAWIQKLAKSRNASVNQTILDLFQDEMVRMDKEISEEERHARAFERTRQLREEIWKKYGKFDDLTKLIREDRDSR